MSEETKLPGRGFKVVDRRFWADEKDETEEPEDAGGIADKPKYVAELEQKLAEKEQLLRQYIAQHKESVSEFNEARARMGREVARDARRTRREVIAEFLDVADNLDRALEATQGGQDPDAVVQGVAMVRDLLLEKLRGFGVRRLEALGSGFDPALHEALTVVPVDDPALDGQIVGVIREGYRMDDEILRPAAVAVARIPAG